MRKSCQALVVFTLLALTAPLHAACEKQALWVWDSSTVLANNNNRNKLLNAAIDDGFTDIYIYVDDAQYTSKETQLKNLISRATCHGIRVWGMEGYRGYFSDTYGPAGLYAAVDEMIAYNGRVASNQRFYGFHSDMEPQDISGDPDTPYPTFHNGIKDSLLSTTAGTGVWKSTQKLDREYLMRDWLDIQKEVSDTVHAVGLKSGGSFPSWPDDYFGEPVGVTWNGSTQAVYKHMLTLVDDYVVMSYNINTANAAARLTGELAYANGMSPKPDVMGGMETNPAIGPPIGYGGGGYTKATVMTDHNTLCTLLSANSSFKGINIHDWEGWRTLTPASNDTSDPGTCSGTPTPTATPSPSPSATATPTPSPSPSPTLPPITTVTFIGNAAEDGYVVESTATSNVGGAVTTSGYNVRAGDDNTNKMVKGFLSFDTASLPDGATITSAKLIMTSKAFTNDPYGDLGDITVAIRSPYFGTGNALAAADFEAAASVANVGILAEPTTTNQAQTTTLSATAHAHVNKTGRTQFRLSFGTQDNGDSLHTRIDFWSGDSTDAGISAYRPVLEIKYY